MIIPKRASALRISQQKLPHDETPDSPHSPELSCISSIREEAYQLDSPEKCIGSPVASSIRTMSPESSMPSTQHTVQPSSRYQPQMIDQDVEDFTTKLDSLVSTFRNESVKEFLSMKRAVLHDQLTTIDTEKKRCNALLCAKQDEIEHLKEKLQTTLVTCETYDKQRNSLAVTAGLLRAKLVSAKLTAMTFKGWREFFARKKTEHQLTRVAHVHHHKALKAKVFQGLKVFWLPKHNAKVAERVDKLVQDERNKLAMHYNKEMELLQSRLEETTAALNRELAAKVDMQDGLKKAFMRGVCALNFEAMNVLNPAQPQFVDTSAFDMGGQGMPDLTSFEPFKEVEVRKEVEIRTPQARRVSPEPDEILQDIHNLIPAESKDSKWKPAPVVGVRPRTAPVRDLCAADVLECRLPSNLGTQQAPNAGKTIVFNRDPEPKVKGKMPVKKAEIRKTGPPKK